MKKNHGGPSNQITFLYARMEKERRLLYYVQLNNYNIGYDRLRVHRAILFY